MNCLRHIGRKSLVLLTSSPTETVAERELVVREDSELIILAAAYLCEYFSLELSLTLYTAEVELAFFFFTSNYTSLDFIVALRNDHICTVHL